MMATISEMYGNGRTKSGAVEDITSEFVSSSSRVEVESAVRSGNVVTIRFRVSRSSQIASGGSVTATITSPHLPAITASGCGQSGSSAIIITLTDGGEFTLRNASESAISASSGNYVWAGITYVAG